MKAKSRRLVISTATATLIVLLPLQLAGASARAKKQLTQLLLGKDVKALTQLPATKEGLNIFYSVDRKNMDERGLDLKNLTKWLKERGVGVDSNEVVTITDVKIDSDKVEVHLAGGGQGRRGSKHAQKTSPVYMRAGGSRINFRYGRSLTDDDLKPEAFLDFMARILDVSSLRNDLALKEVPPEYRRAVESRTVNEGMTYQMVLLSLGEPEQKKINDQGGAGNLAETWYYMKDGHRVVVDFLNGKVTKVTQY
jgi:hypothetical protein